MLNLFHKFSPSAVGFFLLMIVSFGVNAQPVTLDSILFVVENENPEFRVYDSRILAYSEYAQGATALDAPQIGAGFFMTPYNPGMWKSDPAMNNPGMGSFMISGQQMITNPKKRAASENYMLSMIGVDSTMKNSMRNQMFFMVKMAYYEWLIMEKQLRVIEESEVLITYLIQSAELRYTYGMDKLPAYYKAQGMLAEVQSMKLMLDQAINQNRILLNTYMNRSQQELFTIDTTYTIRNYEQKKADTLLIAENRSDYKLLNAEVYQLQQKQNLELAQKYPDFGVRYDHMFPFGTNPQQFSLMFMISVPIAPWSDDMYLAEARGLDFEIESIRSEQQSLQNSIEGKLEVLRTKIGSKKQELYVTESLLIPAMEKNYQVELIGYEQNTQMLFMVLDAWQNLKMAKLMSLTQLMDLLVLQAEYEYELEIIP
ncbi:MAG: TolC family protein [Bacteroidetes bacterium]|nr:TolC family protein [Bacteroidota bacterium]